MSTWTGLYYIRTPAIEIGERNATKQHATDLEKLLQGLI